MTDPFIHQSNPAEARSTMFACDTRQLGQCIARMLEEKLGKEVWLSLQQRAEGLAERPSGLNALFSFLPRITGKAMLVLKADEQASLRAACAAWYHSGWRADHFGRLWLLLQLDASDKAAYLQRVGSLFRDAEMNELALLYAALPFLAYGADWEQQCTEGIRSNIGLVLEAIMYENPYPAAFLREAAWNQMVLKAFFTEKQVNRIIGLDGRANEQLAAILVDYAHERWAAGRPVHPQLWRCVGPFIQESNFPDLEKVFRSADPALQQAGALALAQAPYAPAQALLQTRPDLAAAIREGRLSWGILAEQYP